MFGAEIWKKKKKKKNQSFLSENFQFLELKFSIYLNKRVFAMKCRENATKETKPFQSTR